MLLNLILACPSKGKVDEWLQDQYLQIFLACLKSQRKPSGELILPTSQRRAVNWNGLLRCHMTDVAQSRNQLLHLALNGHIKVEAESGRKTPPADWLFTYDSDNFHLVGDDIVRMIIDGDRRGAAVIAAPVSRRDGWCNFQLKAKEGIKRSEFHNYAGRVFQIDRVGAAFMALNLNWFRAHWKKPPWFAFIEGSDDDGAPTWLSEDYYLCDGVKARGGEIWLDARYEPRHDGVMYHDTIPGHPNHIPLRYREPEEEIDERRENRDPATDTSDDEGGGGNDIDPLRGIRDRLSNESPLSKAG